MRFVADEFNIYISEPETPVRSYLTNYMGATYSKAKDYCKLPRTIGVMDELYANVVDLRSDKAFLDEGFKIQKEIAAMMQARKAVMNQDQDPDDPLRPYQRQDVSYLTNLDYAGIFNEPRTGKTPTLLELIRVKGTDKNLIVAPASLLLTWAMQVRKWLPEASVHVIEGTKKSGVIIGAFKASRAQCILIVSKNSLGYIPELLNINFDLAAIDEAHYLRNYGSVQSKAAFKVKAKQRFVLTGTPTVKMPSDIFGILKFLNPKAFPSYWNFCERYFVINANAFSGFKETGPIKPEREPEMKQLIGTLSVSRKRKDVMSWLPEKEYKTVYTKMGKTQEKYYRDMEKTFVAMAESYEHELDAQNVMVQTMRLRQLAIDPRLGGFKEKGCKTETLLQLLKDQEEQKPVIIMSMFTSYLKLLKEDLEKGNYRVGMIQGEMTAKQKQEAADAFQRGEVDVLLCNIISAGTGWTLDRGDTVIFMDSAWNPSDNEQAEDRVTPTTQANLHGHNVIHISTIGSVDEKMFYMLQMKKSLTDILNNGPREFIKEMMR